MQQPRSSSPAFAILGIALCFSSQAPARPLASLEEIIVTASRIPQPLRRIGSSVTVLTDADINAHGNLALSDILRQQTAIATSRNGGAGQPTGLRIRGEEAYRTLMLLDGLRLGDPSGPQIGPLPEHVPASGIGRVEILRGPQGLGYGADAGGIINMSSLHVDRGLYATVDAQTGSFGTRQYSAHGSGGNALGSAALSVNHIDSKGYNVHVDDTTLRDNDGYRNSTVHANGALALRDNLRLDLVHRRTQANSGFDNCFHPTDFSVLHDCTSEYELGASRAALAWDSGRGTHTMAWSATRSERDALATGVSTFPTRGELDYLEYTGSIAGLAGFDLVFGVDREHAANNQRSRSNSGAHLEAMSTFSERLYLGAGLRHDDNEDFGSNTSHRTSAVWLQELGSGRQLKLKGSLGTGFRAPSPYEVAYNSGPWAAPPAAGLVLQQEQSRGVEYGVEYVAGTALSLELVRFDQRVEDAIVFDLNSFSGYLQDTGISTSRGVEFSGRLVLGTHWQLHANYTHNSTARPDGQQRLRRPQHLANVGLRWADNAQRLQVQAFVRTASGAIDQDGASVVALDNFTVLDASAGYALSPRLQVYLRLENLGAAQYREVRNYNTPGRTAYAGFSYSYGAR
jgi:vitamin B12 transporter